MLEAILLGLISSGVYYVAQQHNDRLKEKEHQKVLNRKAIEADLKHGFQTFFPQILEKFPKLEAVDSEQAEAL